MKSCISKMLESYERGKIGRRQLIEGLVLLAAGARTATAGSTFKGLGINHVALDVANIGRSRDFYQKLLGLSVLRQSATDCFLGLPHGFLTLFQREKLGLDHFCIAIESFEVNAVTEELKRQGLNPDQPSGSNRVYFRDPDGLTVQLSSEGHRPS